MTTGPNTDFYNLDPLKPIQIGMVKPPTLAQLDGQISMKYADFNKAVQVSNPYVAFILNRITIPKIYRRTLVDVKVSDLKVGELPCLPGWHLDCTMEPERDGLPETHFLLVSGAGCRTKFVNSPIKIPIKNGRLFGVNEAVKNQKPDIWKIRENVVTRYNRYNLHAPSPAETEGRRLLIRVTCCDFITPNPIRK